MRSLQQLLEEYNRGTLDLNSVTPEEEEEIKRKIAENFDRINKASPKK